MSDYFALDILAFRNHKMEQLVNPTSYHDSSNGIFSAWIKIYTRQIHWIRMGIMALSLITFKNDSQTSVKYAVNLNDCLRSKCLCRKSCSY